MTEDPKGPKGPEGTKDGFCLRAFLIMVAIVIGLGITVMVMLQRAVQKKSAMLSSMQLKAYCDSPEVRKYYGGRVPRTDAELCEAVFKAFNLPNSQAPAKSIQEIVPCSKVEWFPNSDMTLFRLHCGPYEYVVPLNDQLKKVWTEQEMEEGIEQGRKFQEETEHQRRLYEQRKAKETD